MSRIQKKRTMPTTTPTSFQRAGRVRVKLSSGMLPFAMTPMGQTSSRMST